MQPALTLCPDLANLRDISQGVGAPGCGLSTEIIQKSESILMLVAIIASAKRAVIGCLVKLLYTYLSHITLNADGWCLFVGHQRAR
jgi:hypothetical protein